MNCGKVGWTLLFAAHKNTRNERIGATYRIVALFQCVTLYRPSISSLDKGSRPGPASPSATP